MLQQIRKYIQRENCVNIKQIARNFGLDVSALQPMLDIWVRKGVIESPSNSASCVKSCFQQCQQNTPVLYQYVKSI